MEDCKVSVHIGTTGNAGHCNGCNDPSHYLDSREVLVISLSGTTVRMCGDCWKELKEQVRFVNL